MMSWTTLNVPSGPPSRLYRWVSFCLLAVFVAFALTPSAKAQELQPLLDRLERLERDIRALNLQMARGGKGGVELKSSAPSASPTTPAVALMELRLSEIENDLRSSTGRSEEMVHQMQQISQRLDKLVGDVDYRLGVLEETMRGAGAKTGSQPLAHDDPTQSAPPQIRPVPSPPSVQTVRPGQPVPSAQPGVLGQISKKDMKTVTPPAGSDPKAVQPAAVQPAPAPQQAAAPGYLPAGSPRQQYAFARSLLSKANYDQAELALKEFVEKNADDPLASNARYWLGETYYVRGVYPEAAKTFLNSYQKDKKGPKAQASLLKLGMSLARMDKKKDACLTFSELLKNFPNIASPVKNKLGQERKLSGCR